MKTNWTEGRGAKTLTKPRDALYMALTVLKHYQSWEKHAVEFGYKAPTFQKLMVRTFDTIQPVLFDRFVRLPTITDLLTRRTTFKNFPYAHYATDVKFQPCERPGGRFNERKAWFSGKHKLYGMKLEASVSPQGFCVDMSSAHLGATHDVAILLSRLNVHLKALTKTSSEVNEIDNGEHNITYPDLRVMLVEMGYCGILDHLRSKEPSCIR
ncbi:hypothetical protein H310_12598 [Aphanomyces invadans]|uniref:DDE Tnp4 domain-containing protein n=1 Tax=Aphanomyces invadans TaxID=157072 RepID=A0A024TGN0_9STRA|nr:hypothetical protein H310_12598 [Aphanomyces invadans]ETV93310.1 hypothetical protein H310_12598 [Aphanomyces invadans]|eukprot:XP_008877946.1 hypothetical protein H310_12598 [Aphanomyces invadans]